MERDKLDKIVFLFIDCVKQMIRKKILSEFPNLPLVSWKCDMLVYYIKFMLRGAWTMGFFRIRRILLMKNSGKSHMKTLGVLF